MFPQHFRACKVNINFPNFATIAVNLFQNFFIIAFPHSRNLCELLRADESAEPFAVVHDRHDGPGTDAHNRTQRRRIGRVQLHGLFDRPRLPFREDDVGFQRRGHRVAHDVAFAQVLHVVDAAQIPPADERLGLTLRQGPDGAQVAGAHGVDAERPGCERFGENAPRAVLFGCDGVFAADAHPGFEPPVERVADAVAERQVLGNAEHFARGAVFQQVHRFVLRKPEPTQVVERGRVGVEVRHHDAVRGQRLLHLGLGAAGRFGVGCRAYEHQGYDQQPGQRQEYRNGAYFAVGKKFSHCSVYAVICFIVSTAGSMRRLPSGGRPGRGHACRWLRRRQ